jgi:hypothetical protein
VVEFVEMVRRSQRKESALEAKCVKWARARGIQVSKNTELIGIPDRTFWLAGGVVLAPEFKRPDGKGATSQAQDWHLTRLRECGYDAPVIDSWEAFLAVMKKRGVT